MGSRIKRAVIALVVAGAVIAPSSAEAAVLSCPELPFNPGTTVSSSHYGAHAIRATGTSCVTARRLARRSQSRGAFSYLGFRCTYSGTVARKPWRCTRLTPRSLVTFITIGN